MPGETTLLGVGGVLGGVYKIPASGKKEKGKEVFFFIIFPWTTLQACPHHSATLLPLCMSMICAGTSMQLVAHLCPKSQHPKYLFQDYFM